MTGFRTTEWSLLYTDWDPGQQPRREALCTVGNGFFASRGAAEEARADGPHYPGTYLAGGYNRLESEIAGRVIENEDLVNWPNWLCLNFRPLEGDWFDLEAVTILDFHQELDARHGVLRRNIHFRDGAGRETTLRSRRIVHMRQPHLAAIEWTLVPENWSAWMEIESALDGSVTNSGVERYQDLNGQHLDVLQTGSVQEDEDGIFLLAQTKQSHIQMAQAARTQVVGHEGPVARERTASSKKDFIAEQIRVPCQQGLPLRVEKVVALCTSRDHAIADPVHTACKQVQRAGSFEQMLAAHRLTWVHLWKRCDLALAGVPTAQFLLRFHIYHLLVTASRNTVDRDVGVPSRGWHGEAYRGHILWDELFIIPFLNLRIPELSRELLMYRYRRLDEARWAAHEAGYRGAMYPWQSGSDGREESQSVHLNPRSGRWVPDHSCLQRHVNAAIAYNVWLYYQTTGDNTFLSGFGATMILEIARFWASLTTYNSTRRRYEIRGVMGPDEFHTAYPDSDEPGLNNNAYTNVMASWVLHCGAHLPEVLEEDRWQEIQDELQLSDEEIARWADISQRMFVPFHEQGIISQFEGYENLKEFDWEGYQNKYNDIHRLDRILESEDDTPNRYKASKQADVLMLFYLFSAEELTRLFHRMGYVFEPEWISWNIDYYRQRTSHGSTLSRVVHAWVLARSNRERSWRLFHDALESDVADIQGGTTPEGIHLGAMAGTVDLMQRCYTGIETREDVLWFNPRLPLELEQVHFRLRYRSHWLTISMDPQHLTVSFDRSWCGPVKIGFRDQIHLVHQGETRVFPLKQK